MEEADKWRPEAWEMIRRRNDLHFLTITKEQIDLSPYADDWIKQIVAGGESGYDARPCNYDWILEIREVCRKNNIAFWFK